MLHPEVGDRARLFCGSKICTGIASWALPSVFAPTMQQEDPSLRVDPSLTLGMTGREFQNGRKRVFFVILNGGGRSEGSTRSDGSSCCIQSPFISDETRDADKYKNRLA